MSFSPGPTEHSSSKPNKENATKRDLHVHLYVVDSDGPDWLGRSVGHGSLVEHGVDTASVCARGIFAAEREKAVLGQDVGCLRFGFGCQCVGEKQASAMR